MLSLNPGRAKRVLSSPKCLDRFWGPTSLLFNEYQELLLQGKSSQSMGLTIHLHLVHSLRMTEVIPPLPLCEFMVCTEVSLLVPSGHYNEIFKVSKHHNCINFSIYKTINGAQKGKLPHYVV
jgi:hypothetical protein